MPTNKHSVKDVLEDKSLVEPEVLKSPQVARRYAKGIVLCKQIGFSKGSYANLRQLKHFYTQLYGGKSPSYSLMIRGALDLLNQKIAKIKKKEGVHSPEYLELSQWKDMENRDYQRGKFWCPIYFTTEKQ